MIVFFFFLQMPGGHPAPLRHRQRLAGGGHQLAEAGAVMVAVVRETGVRHDALFRAWKFLDFRETFYQCVAQCGQVGYRDFRHHQGKLRPIQFGHKGAWMRLANFLHQLRGAFQKRIAGGATVAFVEDGETAYPHDPDSTATEFCGSADEVRQLFIEIVAVHQSSYRIHIGLIAHLVGQIGLLVQHALHGTAHGIQRN